MIDTINILQYRKLKNIEINLSPEINVISGTNGTCKTSILHIVSNAFQKVKKTNPKLNDSKSIDILNTVNDVVNPKIESLTKGDKEYNDPASGVSGALYSVSYADNTSLDFRRHNSQSLQGRGRFSVKPNYKKGKSESLPELPVIYLGLSRLYAYGEYQKEENIVGIKKTFPDEYIDTINKIYKDFTGIAINYSGHQKVGDIKIRSEFSSQHSGIDSNTISAGEDNLYIIINALVSLKYYYDSIDSDRDVESILLIDEFDATLHPAYQVKLLNLMSEYSKKYKIQVVFTTHSLYLIEEALKKKKNVIYLMDNITSVMKMEDVDIYKIRMWLSSMIKEDIYSNRSIPIFTEDKEARLFLNCLFEYFRRTHKEEFSSVSGLFHLVEANISSESLKTIFQDSHLLRSTMRSICILDGDQDGDYRHCIITLPGGLNKKSPEDLIFEHAEYIYENDDLDFWGSSTISAQGYTKIYYRDNIRRDIEAIDSKLEDMKTNEISTKGVKREENKKVFKKYMEFFEFVMKNWINCQDNKAQVDKFYKDLKIMFKKVSEFHDISSGEWRD